MKIVVAVIKKMMMYRRRHKECRIVKRMIGLLMMMGLVVGVVGCGDDNNPVKSDEDLLVGTWSFEDGSLVNFSSDGTSVSTVEEI